MYVFISERFLEVALESWPEWDLNPQPTTTEFCSDALIG